jgi:hypothetical protein
VTQSKTQADIYTGDQLCADLRPLQRCFRCARYKEGHITEVFHEHVPSHRLSQASALEVLRTLSSHSAGWPPVYILHSALNKRSGEPVRSPGFITDVSYPEPGVVRYTVSAGDGWAWVDRVVLPDSFRNSAKGVSAPVDSEASK